MGIISTIIVRLSIGVCLYAVDPILVGAFAIFLAERGFIYLERIRKIKERI